MVQNTRRASPGGFSGGRSKIAENSQRSRGSMGVVMDAPLRGAGIIGRQAAMIHKGPATAGAAPRMGLPLAIAVFALAFMVPAWPWLSGAVTIPWDAKSQFFPPVQFLATSIARGEWPWWTPNVFAGWPVISDPQSLLFSPLHVLLAAVNPDVGLRAFDDATFAYLFLGGLGVILFFRDRGWHLGGALVAAMALAL